MEGYRYTIAMGAFQNKTILLKNKGQNERGDLRL